MSDKLTIEQRHRDAAAEMWQTARPIDRHTARQANYMLTGTADNGPIVQAFARFEASLRTPTPEQAGEVERLRLALGSAFETLIYIFECSDDQHVSKAAKATSDEIDAALQSTPPAQPTAEEVSDATKRMERTLGAPFTRRASTAPEPSKLVTAYDASVAQPAADAVERLRAATYWPLNSPSKGYMRSDDDTVSVRVGDIRDALPTTMAGDYVMVPREVIARTAYESWYGALPNKWETERSQKDLWYKVADAILAIRHDRRAKFGILDRVLTDAENAIYDAGMAAAYARATEVARKHAAPNGVPRFEYDEACEDIARAIEALGEPTP